jgi:hypothetical protein
MNGEIDGPSRSPGPTPCPPCRFYSPFYRSGDLVELKFEVGGYPKPDWTALIEQGNNIAKREIKGWLGTIICTNTSLEDLYKELEDLYREINLIRVTMTSNQVLPKSYPLKRVQTDLNVLEKDLPDLISELHAFLGDVAVVGARRISTEALLAEVQEFSQSVARMRVHVPDDAPPIHHKFQAWHNDALFLAHRVRQIAGGQGSLKSISSPLIKFITKALDRAAPAASGRPRTEDAVRQALASHPHRALLGLD